MTERANIVGYLSHFLGLGERHMTMVREHLREYQRQHDEHDEHEHKSKPTVH